MKNSQLNEMSKMELETKLNDDLDAYEKDIRNYTTYDLHRKLQEVK